MPANKQSRDSDNIFEFDCLFACNKCSKTFKVLGSLKRHMNYYCGRKPPPITGYIQIAKQLWQCQTCQRKYKTFNTMKRHLVYECGKQPSISCPVYQCDYKAKIRDRMMQHCRMVHKLKL
ncbi:hypothetical protein HUJ04_008566 [Dendroctonus ponderosae]|nr:hypothetical protein HUJ04_008566 [Dendroctonus ponderosae]